MKRLLFSTRGKDFGLLILRLVAGLSMAILHGWGKITGGYDSWVQLGGNLETVVGFVFLPVFWGFMAAFSEFVCSLMVSLGLLTRLASLMVLGTMTVAAIKHIKGEGSPELAIIYGLIFLTILITGGGKYSFDRFFISNRSE